MQRTSYVGISESMACKFETIDDSFVCKGCGLKLPARLFKGGKPFVICNGPQARQPRGLGDMVADGLNAVGITKERVQSLASKAGIRDCGCSKRQEWMNKVGRNYLGIGKKADIDQK